MQSSSRSRPFKSGLAGASPATDAILNKLMVVSCELKKKSNDLPIGEAPSLNNQLQTIDQSRSQGVSSSARRSAKAEVRGASPRESANLRKLIGNGCGLIHQPSTLNPQPVPNHLRIVV